MTKDVPSLIREAGGEVVGKIRLQKMVYLLDQIGLRSGFDFEYHHYGPYSEALAEQVEDDSIFGRLNTASGRRVSDGVPYAIYRANAPGEGEAIDRNLPLDQIRKALAEMQRHSATVLELAATIHWLACVEGIQNWHEELLRRKGAKVQSGRDKEALQLLGALGVHAPVTQS